VTEKRRALITGALGFCGRHLADDLVAHGYEVCGLDQATQPPIPGVALYSGDIRNLAWLAELLRALRPTHIFHLAALTSPQAGWQALHDVNVWGTGQLLEAVRLAALDAPILVAGSSAAYGAVEPGELPITEEQPFRPRTEYAVSKIAQEMLAYSYHARQGLRLIRTRAFNVTGPGEGPGFVTSSFARQIACIEAGPQPATIKVGNLDAIRDFSDVRDVVRAYRLLAELGKPGEVYNICSGAGTAIRELLDRLLSLSRNPEIRVTRDPTRLQPADVPVQIGSAARLYRATGWQVTIPLQQTLQDVLDSWRLQISATRCAE
jgi:GDP-4-dehydro-6-deoxy-D-mannose reductase